LTGRAAGSREMANERVAVWSKNAVLRVPPFGELLKVSSVRTHALSEVAAICFRNAKIEACAAIRSFVDFQVTRFAIPLKTNRGVKGAAIITACALLACDSKAAVEKSSALSTRCCSHRLTNCFR
jgi:hypothetical protein